MEMEGSLHLRRTMLEQRAAIQRRICNGRERAASSAFSAALLSARAIADQAVSHREKLIGQKDQLRKFEADLAEALSIQRSKKSKYKLISESISNTTATNEQLRSLVMDQTARRDKYADIISNQLEAIEDLEANSDAKGKEDLDEAVMWYNKFLGFQVVGGEGVKFVFNKIDMQSPDKEYSFCIKLTKERYNLLQCVPSVEGSKELVNDLNCNNDLFKFVRIMRERFQAATICGVLPANSFCLGTSSITSSSPSALSVDSRSENNTSQSHTRSGARNKEIPTKKGLPSRSATSPGTMLSSVRRSPRILERR
ncbi:kinetochore protein SPC25 homolog [Phragmites australis]|uniref:kinetochore protein SPC25 homolog n=1 Tax=Phragmites australis TaxID=29695 RepID=UPI002D7780CE|nr:kinetochore protein SPC25 homolog [Phragmites australis]